MRGARMWRAVLGFAMIAAAATAAAAADVAITGAAWKPESSVLRIEGTAARPDSVVLVRDADTRALLGSAAVRADGKWMLKIRNPSAVPARTLAQVGSECVECDVTGPAMAR